MESAAAKAHAQMSQNDFSPQHDHPVGVIPDECGECATNSGCRAKCTPSGKSLCVQGGKAVVRPELFVRLRSKWGRRAYVPGSVLPFETRAAQHLPPPLDEIPQPQGSIQIPLSDVNAFAYLGNSALVNAPPPWPLRRGHCGKRRRR
jgi:hypothetical protein